MVSLRNNILSCPASSCLPVREGHPVWPQTGQVGVPTDSYSRCTSNLCSLSLPLVLFLLLTLMQKLIVDQCLPRHCQFTATGIMINAAMEEAKLIRMATAISRYTHSKALWETIHQAAAMISQATQSVSQLPWIPDTIKADLIRQEQELTRSRTSSEELSAGVGHRSRRSSERPHDYETAPRKHGG